MIPDPALVEGSDLDREIALTEGLRYVQTRVDLFKALPIGALDAASLRTRLDDIGKAEIT